MSHSAHIALTIRDMPALREACERLGLFFCENQQFCSLGPCAHAIHIPGAGPAIGLLRTGNDYALMMPAHPPDAGTTTVGRNGGLLKQLYAVECIVRATGSKRFRTERTQHGSSVRLTLYPQGREHEENCD